ncbi:unnamed protein product [Acanthosepion pharaonis]|uniref:Uncharacterized protein n=1 Tax=Acanthosepion pharaonis TaxID=158019 RepID=A0A812EWB6_ACAPH|nr:unnamed protein product [Sepia pharaonis]
MYLLFRLSSIIHTQITVTSSVLMEEELTNVFESPPEDAESASDSGRENTLQIPDGGWGWVICFAGFMINFIAGGLFSGTEIFHWGLILLYQDTFYKTAMVEIIFDLIMMSVGPIVLLLLMFNVSHRQIIICGGFISAVSTFTCIFVKKVELLYVPYGTISGCCVGLAYFSVNTIVGRYFKKKRALAVGIAHSGIGIGAFVLSYLLGQSISYYGMRVTFLFISGLFLSFIVYGALCRPLKTGNTKKKTNASVMVTVYTPDMIDYIGMRRGHGALIIYIYCGVLGISQVIFGMLADLLHIPTSYILMASLLVSSAVCVAFTFCHSFAWLVFCISLSAICRGFIFPLGIVLVASILGVENLEKGYSPLCLLSGVSYIIHRIIAGSLLDATQSIDAVFYVFASFLFMACIMSCGIVYMQRNNKFSEYPEKDN